MSTPVTVTVVVPTQPTSEPTTAVPETTTHRTEAGSLNPALQAPRVAAKPGDGVTVQGGDARHTSGGVRLRD